MKKISLLILSVFALATTFAQNFLDDNWSYQVINADNNASVIFPAGVLDAFAGSEIKAFATKIEYAEPGDQYNGVGPSSVTNLPVSETFTIVAGESNAIPIMGQDGLCNCVQAAGGDLITIYIKHLDDYIQITNVPPTIYAANLIVSAFTSISYSYFEGDSLVFGCTDSLFLGYNPAANFSVVEQCGDSIINGCMAVEACNYADTANVEDGSCTFAQQYYECSGVPINDEDGDGIPDELEIPGCTDLTAFNYDSPATDDDGSCIPVVTGCGNSAADNYNEAVNTPTNDVCEYSTINPWGPNGGSQEAPTFFTNNNMSVLFPVDNLGIEGTYSLDSGDVIFVVYETQLLENELVNYSEASGIQSGGAVEWTGDQVGMAIFGSDNFANNGFQELESLTWLILTDSGEVYNATVSYGTGGFEGFYEDAELVIVNNVEKGSLFYEGCMIPNNPNYNPLASIDDGSCAEAYSIGCMDEASVNFAGLGANPTHDNAANFGDAFGQNLGLDLVTAATSPSGTAATTSDPDMCQDQVEGCTDPMASNYDPIATQNDATICDWSLNGMELYDVDENGNILATDYNFGAVDPDNQNDGILGSDFANANILFQEGALVVDAHVIENLATVMEWVDADEIADAQELADTITDMQDRYDANDLWWNTRYDDTLAAVAVWFAEDEAADAQELADTIHDMQARYDANDLWWNTLYDATVVTYDSMLSVTNDTLDYHRAPIEIDLHTQWNTVAYYLHHESPVVAQFENQFGSETAIANNINIVKNNEGLFYWPEFNFDGIQMLQPGQGYQVRVKDSSTGKSDFIFEHAINADAYRTLNPTVPAWAIDMPVDVHPNDVRSLVRVVNMLGQEVKAAEQFRGEVLLYMYNDGTVEKKMVQ